MDISGSQKIKAGPQQVFQALLNPTVLKNSIPGCESAQTVNTPTGTQLEIVITTGLPGFKGPYTIYLQASDVVAPSHITLSTNPKSSVGAISAICPIDLVADADGTELRYNAQAQMEGKIAAVPDFVLKPAVKSGLDTFFKNFEKQVSTISAQ